MKLAHLAIVAMAVAPLGCVDIVGLPDVPELDGGSDGELVVDANDESPMTPDTGATTDAPSSSGDSGSGPVGPTPDASGGGGRDSGGGGGGGGYDSGGGNPPPWPPFDASNDGTVVDSGGGGGAVDTGTGGTIDSGCGPTNTVQNCGACGQACSSADPAQCSSGVCRYQCSAGQLDCNASVGYNPDGCECDVSGTPLTAECCSTSCPTQHTDGLTGSQFPSESNFYDCNPTGTYNNTTALEACKTFIGAYGKGKCTPSTCSSNGAGIVCAETGNSLCPCWQYNGANVGKVAVLLNSAQSSTQCLCPGHMGTTSFSWQ